MHRSAPSIADQLFALYGVRDLLLALARKDDSAGGDGMALRFLATSIDIATSTLDDTLESVLVNGEGVDVRDCETGGERGFHGPYDHVPDDSIPLPRPAESPTTISN